MGRRDQAALFPPPGALRKADSDLQKAVSASGQPRGGGGGPHAPSEPPVSPQCLVEAVLVLDVLCRQDPAFLYRVLPCLRALRTRLCGDPACARALLPVARFFLRHGEHLPRWRTGRPGPPHSPSAAGEQRCFDGHLALTWRGVLKCYQVDVNLELFTKAFPRRCLEASPSEEQSSPPYPEGRVCGQTQEELGALSRPSCACDAGCVGWGCPGDARGPGGRA